MPLGNWSQNKQIISWRIICFLIQLQLCNIKGILSSVFQQDSEIQMWNIFSCFVDFFKISCIVWLYSFNILQCIPLPSTWMLTEFSCCFWWGSVCIIWSCVKIKHNCVWEFDDLVCLHWIETTKFSLLIIFMLLSS